LKIQLKLVEHTVGCILCVPSHVKENIGLFKVASLREVRRQLKDIVVFTLSGAIVEYESNELRWLTLLQQSSEMKVSHDHRRHAVASFLNLTFMVHIRLKFCWLHGKIDE
jgi:hypothetical protein